MKKIAKKGIAILIILLIAITTSNVYAQSTITVDKKTYLWTESQRQTKFHTTKGYAFCITPNRTGPSEGKTMTYKSKQSKGGVLYLFDKTGYSDSEYLATQLAIWLYDSNHMSEFWKNHSNLDVVKKAKALSAEASKNSNYTHTPSVKLTTSSSNLSITSDNKYYRSSVITVTMENATEAKLTLEGAPAGATIVNSNYSAISNATNNAKIYVQIPEEKVTGTVNFSIKAEANGQLAEIERYTTGDSGIQELIVLVKTNKVVSYSAKLAVTPVKRSCDYVNGKYYNKKGEVVDKTTYSIDCEPHNCEPVGDVYFGNNGTQVSYEDFVIQCKKPICKKVGDKYVGINGTVVTHEVFVTECGCKPMGDKYLGIDGTEVSYENYIIQCKKPKCDIIDNMYFGINGTRVSEAEYTSQCVHKCEPYNNNYYGSNGTIVTEEEYKRQCVTPYVPVPDTDTSTELIYLIIGALLLGTSLGVITYKKHA